MFPFFLIHQAAGVGAPHNNDIKIMTEMKELNCHINAISRSIDLSLLFH